jgi:hypothetical protein
MVRYSVTMGIRMICLVLVFIFPAIWWVFGIGAVVLPYVAVVFANAGAGGASVPVRAVGVAQAQIEPPRP